MNITRDEILIDLIHYLSFGRKVKDPNDGHFYHISGLKLKDIKRFLKTPIESKGGLTPLECIDREGLSFVNELKTYINKMETI